MSDPSTVAKLGMTPGPWKVKNTFRTPDSDDNYIEITPNGSSGWKGDHYLCVSGFGSPADGLVMAAAPELFQALKDVLAKAPGLELFVNPVYLRARNALAKATGQPLIDETQPDIAGLDAALPKVEVIPNGRVVYDVGQLDVEEVQELQDRAVAPQEFNLIRPSLEGLEEGGSK